MRLEDSPGSSSAARCHGSSVRARAWVRFAHARGMPVHIGRVGTARRVRWARRIGADSIDSCVPLWSRENLDVFAAALDSRQMELL